MTRKRAELIEEEKKKEQVSKNKWENERLAFERRVNDIMKDMSFNVKTIRVDGERITVVGEHEFNMKSQVIQTLREATLERLGGSAKAIFDMNKGLIHILKLIAQAPEGKISTRELLRSINSTSMHKHLQEAEQLGFIKRYTERMPKGQKGGAMVINSITEEGRVLLKLHDELASSSRESRQYR